MRLFCTLLSLLGAHALAAASLISPHSVTANPYFEENRGQAEASASFVARGARYTALIKRDGSAVYQVPTETVPGLAPLTIKFPGAGSRLAAVGEQPLASVTNYYGGRYEWRAIPHFQRVLFREFYPRIDLVWRSKREDLEYEFRLLPGANPDLIRIRFQGVRHVEVAPGGNLQLLSAFGEAEHGRPVAWQVIGEHRQAIRIAIRLDGDTAHFVLGRYDRRLPLWIDPVVSYSTYVGGGGNDAGYAIAADSSGGVYLTGTTSSIGFPAQGSGVNEYGGAFVMKFDATGTLLYNTILAGSGSTIGQAIAVDLAGNAYVAGTTQSPDFPVTKGAWQSVFGGVADAFAVKLNCTGQLIYATYLGGMGQDTGTGIAIDVSGNAYISGYTSTIFPVTPGAAQKLYGGGFSDAFVVKLNSSGSSAVYSTLLGGTGNDVAEAVAVDSSRHACIAGYTDSANLPVQAALQTAPGGEGDALIACLSADGSVWTMVSYLGGSSLDQAFALAIDQSGNLFVAGTSSSWDFPVTAAAAQAANSGSYDAFIAKLSPGGLSLAYATYLGGNGADAALAVAVDSQGDVWIGGYTVSTNFPLGNAWQPLPGGSFDGFISQLSQDGSVLMTSSYIGGTGDDRVYGIALDPAGSVFATGTTLSVNFPVTAGAMQDVGPSGVNAFLTHIDPSTSLISGQVTFGGSPMSGVAITLSGSQLESTTTDSSGNYSFAVLSGGSYLVTPSLSGYTFSPPNDNIPDLSGNPNASFVASAAASVYTISGQVTLSGSGLRGTTIALSGSQTGTSNTDSAGNYTFTVAGGGTYSITPSLTGFSFSPASTTFTGLTKSQTANFPAQCKDSVSPTVIFVDASSQLAPSVTVTAPSACTWTSSGGSFLNITSGSSGTGKGTVTFTVSANGTGAVRTGALTIAGQTVSVTQRATATIFADVNPPDYYFDFANTMYTAQITSGCSTNPLDYCPDAPTTRGQMAVFLIAAIEGGHPFTYTTTPYFTDVSSSSPYFRFVQKLRDLGITSGCTATNYCPNDAVTRGEMAVFIIVSRYGTTPYTYPSTPYFTDVSPSNPFFPFIQKMAQAGITSGCGSGLYCPDQTLNRGQMAIFIVTGLLNRLLAPGTSAITSVAPETASPGQVVTVTLRGVNTHFTQAATQIAAANGIVPSAITVLSATSLSVQLTVGASVSPNPTTIVATTGVEEAALPNVFLVE